MSGCGRRYMTFIHDEGRQLSKQLHNCTVKEQAETQKVQNRDMLVPANTGCPGKLPLDEDSFIHSVHMYYICSMIRIADNALATIANYLSQILEFIET